MLGESALAARLQMLFHSARVRNIELAVEVGLNQFAGFVVVHLFSEGFESDAPTRRTPRHLRCENRCARGSCSRQLWSACASPRRFPEKHGALLTLFSCANGWHNFGKESVEVGHERGKDAT